MRHPSQQQAGIAPAQGLSHSRGALKRDVSGEHEKVSSERDAGRVALAPPLAARREWFERGKHLGCRGEAIARRTGVVARVAVRVNPDIDSGSHPHIATGQAPWMWRI